MNPENTEILVGVGVTDLLHLDHKLEMGTVLRQNRCGRLLFGTEESKQACLIGGCAELMRAGILDVVELVAGEIAGAIEENSPRPSSS
jgi:hypothetical protein